MSQSLGKGLESLIPPKDDNQNTGASGSAQQQPDPPKSIPVGDDLQSDSTTGDLQDSNATQGHSSDNVTSKPDGSTSTRNTRTEQKDKEARLRTQGDNEQQRGEDDSLRRGEAIFYIETENIVPNRQQPRTTFNEEALNELAASIREFGILQPLVVRKVEREVPTGTKVKYELIAGHRRLLASKKVGLERVPAVVRSADLKQEQLELAVIENIQREDLNAIEMARAFARLQDEFSLTQREIATRLGKSRETIANTLRLLDLTSNMQKAVERGDITGSHGRMLLSVDNPELQRQAFEAAIKRGLTTRDLKNVIRKLKRKQEKTESQSASENGNKSKEFSPRTAALAERLSERLGAPVNIRERGEKGNITITFYSQEELEALAQKLARDNDIEA